MTAPVDPGVVDANILIYAVNTDAPDPRFLNRISRSGRAKSASGWPMRFDEWFDAKMNHEFTNASVVQQKEAQNDTDVAGGYAH
jgi:hypothetical protein